MNSLKQFFSFMNDISFEYVVLRNWDSLPYDVVLGEHSDLDLLVYDIEHFKEIFPQAKSEYPYPRVRMKIPIGDSFVYLDVRHLGDDYYPIDFERSILSTREFNIRGFYTPNPIHHRIALAYHAVHHKGNISRDYLRFLGDSTIDNLLKSLMSSPIGWSQPKDPTVGRFYPYWKGATCIVERVGEYFKKSQVSYLDYPLIENERKILNSIPHSHHFPIAYLLDNELFIQDCGEKLTVDNIPDDWKSQLDSILCELKTYNIIHRDIRLDNLLVRDGIIKLIDFGWAKKKDEEDIIEVPECLGYPNRLSTGFSDEYSMRCVRKQIEYLLEEKLEKVN